MSTQSRQPTAITAEEEYEIWGLLIQVRDMMIRLRDREVKPIGLTSMQGGVLWVLHELKKSGEPATPAEVSRRLFRRPPTISALLERMEKQGLVQCVRHPDKKRQIRVETTAKGKEALREFLRKREVIPSIIGCISSEERSQLRASLAKMRQKAHEQLVTLPPFP